jgi:hypothetical protein
MHNVVCCGVCSEAKDHVEQLNNVKECIIVSVVTVASDCGFTLTGSNINSGRCASKGPAHFLLIAN